MSRIDYGNYMIFIIRHWRGSNGDFFKDYPVRKTADGYALTNELQDDPVYTYVSTDTSEPEAVRPWVRRKRRKPAKRIGTPLGGTMRQAWHHFVEQREPRLGHHRGRFGFHVAPRQCGGRT